MKEMVGGCCVCADDNGWSDNPLIYCDGDNCEVAVHQGCYGIQEVPEGNWYCAKCSKANTMLPGNINEAIFCCQLCPFSYGALKKTDRNGWAHVICALYIPEVRFGDVHSMEPVILTDIPVDNARFQKTCYICNEERPNEAKKGACMSCNKPSCKRSFHVTCAQRKGLLCEEGAISKNVKYCGYCESHLKKAINDPAIKIIPACPPVQNRLAKDQEKTKKTTSTVLLTPPPLPPPVSKLMLADPIRPTPLGSIGSASSSSPTPPSVASVVNSINSVKLDDNRPTSTTTEKNPVLFAPAFSPPLTTSSRSSVALDPTPPLPSSKNSITSSGPLLPSTVSSTSTTSSSASSTTPMANGVAISQETTVGLHCMQQLQIQSAAAAAGANPGAPPSDLNGYPGPSQLSSFMHEIPARNTTSVASLLPPGAAEYHLNGSGDEEKTVKAVLTAPLAKAKRMRDVKGDLVDKTAKRPRANARPPGSHGSGGGTVGKSASMQRLINLVQPVVSETVTDFQRDRVADRTAAERRAAVAQSQPSTSTNGVSAPSTSSNPTIEVASTTTNPGNHPNVNGLPSTSSCSTVPVPGASGNADPTATVNGTTSTPNSTQSNRLNLPSFMEQLLERQWDQGSTLLMQNAHFDVAQLLSCLFQLKSENIRLEENLSGLRKRRDHLFALNSRLTEVNTLDVTKRQSLLLHPDIIPKTEHKPDPIVQANHSSQLFEDVKPAKPSHRKNAHSTAVPLTTAPPVTTTASAAPQNHRATPSSTTGTPIAPTPIMTAVTAANELSTLSPDRMTNGAHALFQQMYRNMPMDPTVAAQLSMLNNQALFSSLLRPGIAGLANIINGNMHPSGQPLTTIAPSTSGTPNGK